ncbi:MAG: GNAT family N-acetyltransferase [Planctomycetaceae bacterium]|nr:GNAT family N-acetyltransferase [Planctomycetaceae bacterium]
MTSLPQEQSERPKLRADLVDLEWDSELFGFPVARIVQTNLDDAAIQGALREAARRGVRLAYWSPDAKRPVSEDLLARWGGRLVDRRAVFQRSLEISEPLAPGLPGAPVVEEYSPGPASDRIITLSLLAGQYSRFRMDTSIPPGVFERLYTSWGMRSTTREIADVVLVARQADSGPVGLITGSIEGSCGVIGLVSVDPGFQRLGIGAALLRSVHDAFRSRGAAVSRVATQMQNRGACLLYQKAGYELIEDSSVFHFWLAQEPPDGAASLGPH